MKSVIMNQLAQNIRRLRVERKWTQEFLAQRAGITPTSVVHLETARTWLRPDMVTKLATALEVEESELFALQARRSSIPIQIAMDRIAAAISSIVDLPDDMLKMLGKISNESQVYVLRNTLIGLTEEANGDPPKGESLNAPPQSVEVPKGRRKKS